MDLAAALRELDDLWTAGRPDDAVARGEELASTLFPAVADLHEKLALFRIWRARLGGGPDQLLPALQNLNRALEIEPHRVTALELRATLLGLLGGLSPTDTADPLREAYLGAALKDFLLLEIQNPHASAERLTTWRLEAARAAFQRFRIGAEGTTAAQASALFGRVDPDALQPVDWFHRGLALADGDPSPESLRTAAQCFLRVAEDVPPEEGGLALSARYFAAHTLLSLEHPTQPEYLLCRHLVGELLAHPQPGLLVEVLTKRLRLAAQLLGEQDPFPPGTDPATPLGAPP